jgi:hypothetical protein
MVWHDATPAQFANAIQSTNPDIVSVCWWHNEQPHLYVVSRRLALLRPQDQGVWFRPLPPVDDLLREAWPGVADVFCAETPPVFSAEHLGSPVGQCTQHHAGPDRWPARH